MPRNVDVMALCEALERNVSGNVTAPPTETLQHIGNVSVICPVCQARREADRARLARYRARRRGMQTRLFPVGPLVPVPRLTTREWRALGLIEAGWPGVCGSVRVATRVLR